MLQEQTTCNIIYKKVDVSDFEQVASLVEFIEKGNYKLKGIIHSAGIIQDNFILKKTTKEFREVLASKVSGTFNLDIATKNIALDFFVLFSSISAPLGSLGQADYATANSFMDHFAQYRDQLVKSKSRQGKTLSLNWPLWEEGGMKIDATKETIMRQTTGMVAMPTQTGLQTFYQAISSNQSQILVLEGMIPKIKESFFAAQTATPFTSKKDPASKTDHSIQEQSVPQVDLSMLKEKTLAQIKDLFGKVIKLPTAKINVEENFEAYGIDSVIITEMNHELSEVFGEISKTLFFEYPSLNDLTHYLIQEYPSECLSWTGVNETFLKNGIIQSTKNATTASEFSKSVLSSNPKTNEAIAIIGISGMYPQANNVEQFWENLKTGRDCITEIPSDRWSLDGFFHPNMEEAVEQGLSYSKWGGFLEPFAEFDPRFFQISPKEAMSIDPQERLFLQSAWQAMEDAGYTRSVFKEKYQQRVGVFAGITKTGFNIYGPEIWQQERKFFPHTSFCSLANRLSYFLNIQGPSMPIDTMCSSSLTAIHEACEHIHRGECTLAFAGGLIFIYIHLVTLCFARHKCLRVMANAKVLARVVMALFLVKE